MVLKVFLTQKWKILKLRIFFTTFLMNFFQLFSGTTNIYCTRVFCEAAQFCHGAKKGDVTPIFIVMVREHSYGGLKFVNG
jgi:hypothetical protein